MVRVKGVDFSTSGAFLKNEFYNLSIYKTSFWFNFVFTFLMMYTVGYVWRALYATNPNVSDVPLPQMITYAVLGIALEAVLHPHNGPQIYMMEQVRKGAIELDILKPIDFQFYMFSKTMGVMFVRLVFLVLPSLVIAHFLFSFQIAKIVQMLLFLISLLLSFCISFLLNFFIGLISMVTMNIKNIYFGYNALLRFFAGQMIPLWLYPSGIKYLSDILPFRGIYAIPMSIYVGDVGAFGVIGDLLFQFSWIVILLVATRLYMKYVFKRLMIQGG